MPKNESDVLEAPIGIFNVADSYYAAVELLAKARIPTSHSSFPTHFLFNQALELYLKAFLRLHGGKSRGHNFGPLVKRAEKKGLPIDMFLKQTLELLDANDVAHKSRYLRVRYYENHPTTDLLQEACHKIRREVSNKFKSAGQALRPNPLTYAFRSDQRESR